MASANEHYNIRLATKFNYTQLTFEKELAHSVDALVCLIFHEQTAITQSARLVTAAPQATEKHSGKKRPAHDSKLATMSTQIVQMWIHMLICTALPGLHP